MTISQQLSEDPASQQRRNALRLANIVRSHRAQLKRDLSAGRTSFEHVLLARDPMLSSMKIKELLLALPKVGKVKADRLCLKASVRHSTALGSLTERQRRSLIALLR